MPLHRHTALLLVDLINPLDFPGSAALRTPAIAAARAAHTLKLLCKRLGIAAIYANDNYGRWQSDLAV